MLRLSTTVLILYVHMMMIRGVLAAVAASDDPVRPSGVDLCSA
jgi:hypothetical protein